MTKFRYHRGSLCEAMKTECEVADMDELLEVLNASPMVARGYMPRILRYEVLVKPYHMKPDDRIDWDETWIVTVDGSVWGFTDGAVL